VDTEFPGNSPYAPWQDGAVSTDQIQPPSARYNFDIFNARGVRKEQLCGTPYRYWHSHAIAHIFGHRLSGTVDVLDAGGRDGGTLRLLKGLALRGSYTCLDLKPTMAVTTDPDFDIETIASAFKDFSPRRCYDAVLFQTSLECVKDYKDIAWVPRCLKPRGFVVATLHCTNTRRLYHAYRKEGGLYPRNERELAPAFAEIGLQLVELFALGGVASRLTQYVTNSGVAYYPQAAFRRSVGLVFPELRRANLIDPLNRVLNPWLARMDRVFHFRPIGHCLVLEPARGASLAPRDRV
jgi:hypothetical protein